MIKDLFGILAIVIVNVINHVTCKRKIIGELVEECSKNIDENEVIYNETLDRIPLNDYKKRVVLVHYLLYF